MKKYNLSITVLVLACFSLLFGGCSTTTLSMKQQEALSTVSVSKVQVLEDAYSEPNARKSSNAADAGGMAGGFIGSLVGSAIDAGVMASQQKKFVEQYGEEFEEIKEMMPTDLSNKVETCLITILENDVFFEDKLYPESDNRFVSEIRYFGLKRSETATPGNMLMGFHIEATISLVNGKNKDVFSTFIVADSKSCHLVSDYTEDPTLIQNACNESIEEIEVKFSEYLNQKLGRKS